MDQQSPPSRIFLSPPHIDGDEQARVQEAFASNYIAPAGPHLAAFEEEVAAWAGVPHAVALSSGTAGIHLAPRLAGVGPGDIVLCPTLTFVATANPIRYCGAEPVFIDSERRSWNMDPRLLEEALKKGPRPRAVLVVDLFGQCADLEAIERLCAAYEVPLVEDAADAIGARCGQRPAGNFGQSAIFSFNGNKIITTGGGGMLVTRDPELARQARKLATQAREPAVHYEHRELGYNYRLSNVLAAIGRGQLARLEAKVARRREIFETYRRELRDLPLSWMPEADFGPGTRCTRWLSCALLDPEAGLTPHEVCAAMEKENIECRPVWKPMHRQPLYAGCLRHGGAVAEELYARGLCLPSGSGLTSDQQTRVITTLEKRLDGQGSGVGKEK